MNTTIDYNDLFYTASLIEFIGRKTTNTRRDIVATIGIDGITHLLQTASVNHCLSMEQVSTEVIEQYGITNGAFDNVRTCRSRVPAYKAIGAVFARLVQNVAPSVDAYPQTFYEVFTSEFSDKISDFNSAWFYTPSNQLAYYYQESRKQ